MAPSKIVFVVGPTASGKSALAIDVAKQLNGEIICADSRTIYRGLDVSTAKPTASDRSSVVHYGLDLLEPSEKFSAAQFKTYTLGKIADITSRGRVPIIVGGTGLYIDGLLFNFNFGPAANNELRAELEPLSIEQLQQIITKKGITMPENSKNKRYLIRAIEQGRVAVPQTALMPGAVVVGLNPGLPVLEARIRARAQAMLDSGALQEAEWLFKTYGYNAPAASAPFFKAYAPHFLQGETLQDCQERFILNDRQLAKRQIAWFKRNNHVQWFADAGLARIYVVNKCIDSNNIGKNSSNRTPL